MKLYRAFIISFCLSAFGMILFMIQYINAFRHIFEENMRMLPERPNAFLFFNYFFTPVFIITCIVLGLTSLIYRILGIVIVAKNKKAEGGEQALWILGFLFLGTITGIVFIVLAKSRQLIHSELPEDISDPRL